MMQKLLRITYSFQEGSLPPPHHYEYEICLESHLGLIRYIPDYPSNNVPIWQIPFPTEPGIWNQICEIPSALMGSDMHHNDPACIGGAQEKVVIEFVDDHERTSTYLMQGQDKSMVDMYQKIRFVVPSAIWEELDLRRARYWRTEDLKE